MKSLIFALCLLFVLNVSAFAQSSRPMPYYEPDPDFTMALSIQPFFWPDVFASVQAELHLFGRFSLNVPMTLIGSGVNDGGGFLSIAARLRFYFSEDLDGFFIEGGPGAILTANNDPFITTSLMMGVRWVYGDESPKGTFTELKWGYGGAADNGTDFLQINSVPLIAFHVGYAF